MNAAREKVRVARALTNLPKISEAFRRGEVSFSKVRAMTRVATPETEDYLLMIAQNGTAHHVETLVRGFRRAERLNESESAEHQFETRSFNYRWDEDGSLVFKGRLPAEVGAMLMKALKSSIDRKDKEVSAVTPDDEETDSYESLSKKRADAIAEMAESYLETGPAESSSADRYQVMLRVAAGKTSHIEDGPTLPRKHRRSTPRKTRGSIYRRADDPTGLAWGDDGQRSRRRTSLGYRVSTVDSAGICNGRPAT